jgi:hypothetical protein
MGIMYFRPQGINLGSALSAFLTEMENGPISGSSMSESQINLEASLDEEEARLRERLDKIAQMKRLARELGYSLSAATSSVPLPPAPQLFDGTIAGLIRSYRTHERSPYRELKARVRNNYDGALNRISDDIGHERISDLNADRIKYIHRAWAEGGKLSQAHSFAGKLRLLSGFGATILDDADCIRFSSIMRSIRFPAANARTEQMTAAHANAIRAMAHQLEWHSIALAQAIQFDLKLRSIDVIGEWIPMAESPPSDIVWGNEKWVRGLRWSDIDAQMMLRFSIGDRMKRKINYVVDLTGMPMVKQELDLMAEIPRAGPMIICEASGRPWSANEWRRKWRIVAARAGVPDNVRNGDSIRAEVKDSNVIARIMKTAGT